VYPRVHILFLYGEDVVPFLVERIKSQSLEPAFLQVITVLTVTFFTTTLYLCRLKDIFFVLSDIPCHLCDDFIL